MSKDVEARLVNFFAAIQVFFTDMVRPAFAFFTLILTWNFLFPVLIYSNGIETGAVDYFDFSEILTLSIVPLMIFLVTHISTYKHFSKGRQVYFGRIINILATLTGVYFVMIGYSIVSSNLPGLIYYQFIPETINFGQAALLWVVLLIQGTFNQAILRVDFPTPPRIDFKGFRRDRSSLAKTVALPKSDLSFNPPAEVAIEPKPEVKSAPEPVAQAAPESKTEVSVEPKPAVENPVETEVQPKVEIKAEPVLPKKQELLPIGTRIENVEFEENTGLNRSGLRTKNRIGGKVSFPDRRGPQPQAGDVWTVEISGTNPNDSVYFVKCIQKESSLEERLSQKKSLEVSNGQDPYQGIQL